MSSATASKRHSATSSAATTGGFVARIPLIVLLLCVVGAGVAGYLTYTHYDESALVCSVGDCGTVQKSKYAEIGPIPIAILGLGMYAVVALTALARILRRGPLSFDGWTIASWAISFAGLLYAGYLTYVEIWVIDAICQWCVTSAIVTLLIVILESILIWRLLDAPE